MQSPYLHTQGGAAADEEGEEEEGGQRLAIQVDVSVDTGTCNICAAKVRTEADIERRKPKFDRKVYSLRFVIESLIPSSTTIRNPPPPPDSM
jgi:hypothetical protein